MTCYFESHHDMLPTRYCTKLETELINFRAVASSDLQENVNSMNRYGWSRNFAYDTAIFKCINFLYAT